MCRRPAVVLFDGCQVSGYLTGRRVEKFLTENLVEQNERCKFASNNQPCGRRQRRPDIPKRRDMSLTLTDKDAHRITTHRHIRHIKVDWETLQIKTKCRDKLRRPMAGLEILFIRICISLPEDYKGRQALKSCHIGVSSHPLMWLFFCANFRRKHRSCQK